MNSDKPVNVLISDFISEMDSEDYVLKNVHWVLNRFVKWMVKTKIDVREPRRADIIHYKNSLITEGKTPTTINTYLAPIRRFFSWLERNNIYSNITSGLKVIKDDRQFRKEYLKPHQITMLLELIQTDTIVGLRNYAMINLMVHLGLRRIELLRLTVADLDTDMVLHIKRKGRKYKEPIQLHKEIYEPIERYFLARENYLNSDPMFANHSRHSNIGLSNVMVSKIIKKYLKQINDSKRLTCHSLRHSAAINLLKAGKSIYDVQQLLGHTSVNTTQAYLKAIEAEQRFNNPLSRDLIDMYKNTKKTYKNKRLGA